MLKQRALLQRLVYLKFSSTNSSLDFTQHITTAPHSATNSDSILHEFVNSIKIVNLPPSAVPTAKIFDKILPKLGQRTHISDRKRKFEQIVAEIDFLYTLSTEVPSVLTDEHWVLLLDTVSPAEREHLLRSIYYAQLVERTAAERQAQHNGTEMQNGTAEAANCSSAATNSAIYQLFGDEFCDPTALRNRIDTQFGLALCRNFLLEPSDRMPNLLVDCRFMHAHKVAHILSAAKRVNQLHMTNWVSSAPFPMSIVNFFADDAVNRIVKNQWHFLYGTPNEGTETEGSHNFVPHPFAPQVTTRGVSEICARNGIERDQIAYVSQRAIDYLPENIGQFRAFVLLPFDDWEQKWLLPTRAAQAEQIPCYRLPLDQHICDVSRNIPCWLVANILRAVYTGRMSWSTAAHHWGRELTSLEYRPNSDQVDPKQLPFSSQLYKEKRQLRAQMLEKLKQYSDMLQNQKQQKQMNKTTADGNGQPKQPQMDIRHARRGGLTPALVGSVKKRKYSREERNRHRMEEAQKGNGMDNLIDKNEK